MPSQDLMSDALCYHSHLKSTHTSHAEPHNLVAGEKVMEKHTRTNLGVEPAVLKEIYRQMARIRAVDKAIQAGLSGGKFFFSYWPMTGQESIPAVLSQLTSKRDY